MFFKMPTRVAEVAILLIPLMLALGLDPTSGRAPTRAASIRLREHRATGAASRGREDRYDGRAALTQRAGGRVKEGGVSIGFSNGVWTETSVGNVGKFARMGARHLVASSPKSRSPTKRVDTQFIRI